MLKNNEIREKWRQICTRDRRKGDALDSGAFAIELARWVESRPTPDAPDVLMSEVKKVFDKWWNVFLHKENKGMDWHTATELAFFAGYEYAQQCLHIDPTTDASRCPACGGVHKAPSFACPYVSERG